MLRLRTSLLALCISLCCSYVAAAPGAGPAPAANAGCSQEARSGNTVDLAQARMQAARADLGVDRGGRCRSNALRLEQYAYQALEDLQKQESHDTNQAVKTRRLQAINATMTDLRTAEQAVQGSMKNDPQGKVGVDVTALDNAMHDLDGGYRMAASAETPPGQAGGATAATGTAACEALSGPMNSDADKVMARLTTAREDLSGKYKGLCRKAALDHLDMAGRNLEAMLDAEVKAPSFPSDKVQESRRQSALKRARQYQLDAAKEVQDSLAKDPQSHYGVNVSPINNALATLKASYGG